jgi:hypothetical protein
MGPAALAGLLVALGQILGWKGVDLAAQVYRVNDFRTSGFTLWDFQWYGGHFTLDYTVIYPPLAALMGVIALAVLSAALATFAFTRLAEQHFGKAGRPAAFVFAAGTLVTSSIGQLTFLTGEAFALAAFWAGVKGRWWAATGLALGASLVSPLAGAFVAMGAAAWVLSRLRARTPDHRPRDSTRWWKAGRRGSVLPIGAMAAAAAAPVATAALVFPGQGPMPYPAVDYTFEAGIAVAFLIVATLKREPAVAWGAVVFFVTATFAELVPSSLGGNVGRIEDVLALPMAVALLWASSRLLLPVLAWPLVLSQWVPAWGATAGPSQPSTHRAFFVALDTELRELSAGNPKGRVEVVPTEYHWEAAYVAPIMPLARGWERQLDVADNPVFYQEGGLTPGTYRSWLIDNGVRYVAVPDAPLDSAAKAEAQLVSSGTVPGLRLIWRSADWRLYSVLGSNGIVSSPAQLVSASGNRVVVDTPIAGSVLIRVHTSPYWVLAEGTGCIVSGRDVVDADESWITVQVPHPEQFSLKLSLLSGGKICPATGSEADALAP